VPNLSLIFDVLAKDNASGTFKNVGDSAERAGKQTSSFGSTMASGMKIAAGALLGAGLIEGFKSLYQAADESRKIAALTTQVIKSTGGAAGVSAKQVGDLAGAIAKKTGVDDEAIQSGQNLLLTFTNVKNVVGSGNDIFNQATKIMTDMSVALGTDASGSAIQLGKALNDPIKGVTALQRVGVSFTASQKEQIKTLVETGDTLGAQKIILGNSTRSSVARLRLPRPRWRSSSSGSATSPNRWAATCSRSSTSPRRSSWTSCCPRSPTSAPCWARSSCPRSRRSPRSSALWRTSSTRCRVR
jgi:hypothetical protein